MRKLHKNFSSSKQTVETMPCGLCYCAACGCGGTTIDIYAYNAQQSAILGGDSGSPYTIFSPE